MMERNFAVVGHPVVRLEAKEKLTGQAVYTDDMTLPGMVYAAVVRSPYARAVVTGIDLSAAESVPGYVGALLPDEVPDTLYNCSGNPPSALLLKDEKILTKEPKCAGDRILCIAAETPEACREACEKVILEYRPQSPFFTIDEALKKGAEPLQPHLSEDNVIWKREVKEGDTGEGF